VAPVVGPHGSSRLNVLVGTTILALLVTGTSLFAVRQQLVGATAWVTHIDEVRLLLAECEVRVAQRDWPAFRAAQGRLATLTANDPPFRTGSIDELSRMTASQGAAGPLETLLTSMQMEEDQLLQSRLAELNAARYRSRAVFVLGGLLALAAAISVVVILRAQNAMLLASSRGAHRGKALLEAVIETVDEGIIAIDAERRTIAINPAARAMVGETFARERFPEEWRSELTAEYEDGSKMAPEEGPIHLALHGEASDDVVFKLIPAGQAQGTWVSTSARPIRDEAGQVVAAVATLRDMTEQRASSARLRDLALTDELTGLLNRRGFLDAARSRVEAARRAGGALGLLYADMDGLKTINDRFGHEQGDRAIADVAAALRRVFREGDVVARIGGDEFIALLPNFAPASEDGLLKRLASSLEVQASTEKRPYQLGVSAGVTYFEGSSAPSLEELLERADRAMYERKRSRSAS
jgi:diguanylate cyclase (GGDEF)-like protein